MQRLESQSKLRNPVIVEVFRDLGGFIEKMGTGVQRMARALEQHGLLAPRFEELGGEFRVTLVGPGKDFMQSKTPEWMQGLNERQIGAMAIIARQGRITNREYREEFAVSDTTALTDLSNLVKRGLLTAVGLRRSRIYQLAENAR